jgi:hypothetical protein
LNCRFTTEGLVRLAVTAAWEVELGPTELNGDCWGTSMFVMLSVNGEELPVYVQ